MLASRCPAECQRRCSPPLHAPLETIIIYTLRVVLMIRWHKLSSCNVYSNIISVHVKYHEYYLLYLTILLRGRHDERITYKTHERDTYNVAPCGSPAGQSLKSISVADWLIREWVRSPALVKKKKLSWWYGLITRCGCARLKWNGVRPIQKRGRRFKLPQVKNSINSIPGSISP